MSFELMSGKSTEYLPDIPNKPPQFGLHDYMLNQGPFYA